MRVVSKRRKSSFFQESQSHETLRWKNSWIRLIPALTLLLTLLFRHNHPKFRFFDHWKNSSTGAHLSGVPNLHQIKNSTSAKALIPALDDYELLTIEKISKMQVMMTVIES